MDALYDLEQRLLHDPEFKQQWENDAPEREILSVIARLRSTQKLSQKELAERIGIRQGDLSKIENGKVNPTLSTLRRIADGLDMKLDIRFIAK